MNKRRRYKAKRKRAERKRTSQVLLISISNADWTRFSAALDAPPEPNEALRRLMANDRFATDDEVKESAARMMAKHSESLSRLAE